MDVKKDIERLKETYKDCDLDLTYEQPLCLDKEGINKVFDLVYCDYFYNFSRSTERVLIDYLELLTNIKDEFYLSSANQFYAKNSSSPLDNKFHINSDIGSFVNSAFLIKSNTSPTTREKIFKNGLGLLPIYERHCEPVGDFQEIESQPKKKNLSNKKRSYSVLVGTIALVIATTSLLLGHRDQISHAFVGVSNLFITFFIFAVMSICFLLTLTLPFLSTKLLIKTISYKKKSNKSDERCYLFDTHILPLKFNFGGRQFSSQFIETIISKDIKAYNEDSAYKKIYDKFVDDYIQLVKTLIPNDVDLGDSSKESIYNSTGITFFREKGTHRAYVANSTKEESTTLLHRIMDKLEDIDNTAYSTLKDSLEIEGIRKELQSKMTMIENSSAESAELEREMARLASKKARIEMLRDSII